MIVLLIIVGGLVVYLALGSLVRILGAAVVADDDLYSSDESMDRAAVVIMWPIWLLFMAGSIASAMTDGALFLIARTIKRWREQPVDKLQRQIDQLEALKRELERVADPPATE